MKSVYVKFLEIVKDELNSEFLRKGMNDVISYVSKLESEKQESDEVKTELKLFGVDR